MNEVVPGAYRIELPLIYEDPLFRHVNAYLFSGDNGYLLVDTGWNDEKAFVSLKNQLAEGGIDIRDISRIVVTHIHPDHYGMAGRLKSASGATFFLHSIEQNLIEPLYIHKDKFHRHTADWLHRNGVPPKELLEIQKYTGDTSQFVIPTSPDVSLHGGEHISTGTFNFTVIWTPGHSEGHICLYEPAKKILISGDHILPTITPHVGLHPESTGNPLKAYFASLKEIASLDIDLILPGHESPFTAARTTIEKIIQHYRQTEAEVLPMLAAKPQTAYQVCCGMTWTGTTDWQNLTSLQKRLAIARSIAQMELLVINGNARKFSQNSIIYYQKT